MFRRYWWMLPVMGALGMFGGLLVAAVVTYKMPKIYESFATIEIKPAVIAGVHGSQMHESFLPTEMEKIKAKNTLMRAVDTLDLTNKWRMDRERVLGILRKCVETENISGTDLIRIRVRHTNREDARDIAAEAVQAYRDSRRELESKSKERRVLYDLRKAVSDQQDNLLKAKSEDMDMEMALLKQLELKLNTEEIRQYKTRDVIVVHEYPAPALDPVSPQVGPNLMAGMLGGLLVSPFLALPLMLWMNRRPSVHIVC